MKQSGKKMRNNHNLLILKKIFHKSNFSTTLFGLWLFFIFNVTFAFAKTDIKEKINKSGKINLSLDEEPSSLHPVLATSGYAVEIQNWVCDSLMSRNLDTYSWEASLADKWEVSPDNKMITITLKKELLFHDGKPITAEDVKFSFDAIMDGRYETAHLKSYFDGIEKIEILEPLKLKFSFKNNYFKNIDVIAAQLIIPKSIYENVEKSKKMTNELVCSGPYKLDSFTKGKGLELKRFDKHYSFINKDTKVSMNNFQFISYKFISDENLKMELFKKGDLDFIDLKNAETYDKRAVGDLWSKNIIKYKVENKLPKSWSYVGWNLEKEIFKDKNVRWALAMLTPREEINKKFFGENLLMVSAPIFPNSEYAPNIKPVNFNIKKAMELLKKSGWVDTNKDGVLDKLVDGKRIEFRFTLSYANREFEKLWVLVKSEYKRVGIEMDLRLMDFNQMLTQKMDLSFDAMAMSWGGGSVEPDPKLIWHSTSASKGGLNFIGYKNKDVDVLIEEARQTVNKKKRQELIQKVYQLIAEDQPYLFMFSDRFGYYATSAKVGKLKSTFNYGLGMSTWWIKLP